MKASPVFFLIILTLLSATALAQEKSKPQPILVAEIGAGGRARQVSAKRIAPNSSLVARDSNYRVEKYTFDLLNSERASRGLRPLVWDEGVARIARLHSRNMASDRFFSHRGPDGSTVDTRADMLGLNNWTAIAENIAFLNGHNDPAQKALEKWLSSPSHRKNMLGSGWTRSAIGIAVAPDGGMYFTHVFMTTG